MFHWYGFFIGIAIVVGYSVAERIEPKVSKVAPWVIGIGLLGARAWHVVDMWSYYAQNWWQILAVWNGGMSIWGGMIGGGVGFLIANHKFSNSQIERKSILAAIAIALPLSQAIGRLGNAVNGEFTNLVWILPWWAAEAILDLMLFGILCLLRARKDSPLQGHIKVLVYLIGYGLIRYFLQPYR